MDVQDGHFWHPVVRELHTPVVLVQRGAGHGGSGRATSNHCSEGRGHGKEEERNKIRPSLPFRPRLHVAGTPS